MDSKDLVENHGICKKCGSHYYPHDSYHENPYVSCECDQIEWVHAPTQFMEAIIRIRKLRKVCVSLVLARDSGVKNDSELQKIMDERELDDWDSIPFS